MPVSRVVTPTYLSGQGEIHRQDCRHNVAPDLRLIQRADRAVVSA